MLLITGISAAVSIPISPSVSPFSALLFSPHFVLPSSSSSSSSSSSLSLSLSLTVHLFVWLQPLFFFLSFLFFFLFFFPSSFLLLVLLLFSLYFPVAVITDSGSADR